MNLTQIAPLFAHRGASAYAPENTIKAFDEAKRLGANAIEFDVMMNHENELFIFHDKTLKRTALSSGQFYATSTKDLQALDVGRWFSSRFKGEKIPTFKTICDWFNQHQLQANIELKPNAEALEVYVSTFLGQLNQYWNRQTPLPLVSSFDQQALALCAQLSPELPLGLLLHRWTKTWHHQASAIHAKTIHLSERQVTKKRIQLMRDAGYQVGVYTVNSKHWAKRYYALGASMVFSDYPDLMEH